MPNYIEQLGQQMGSGIASNIVGTGMGLLLEGHNDRRQREQQQRMNEIENARAKEMVDYNYGKQLEMWKATSYGAQKEQMIKAGLNPALMYGMSGGGGQTTGTAQGGNAGAQAPSGGREIIDAMGINMQAAQLSLLEAQRKNIEADTAQKQQGAKTGAAQEGNIKQDTAIKEVQERILFIEEEIKGKSQNAQIAIILHTARETYARMEKMEAEGKVAKGTADTQIEIMKTQLAKNRVDVELTRAQEKAVQQGMKKTAEEIDKIKKEVEMLDNYWKLDDFIERKKVELIDKGINVAIISAMLGGIMNIATMGRKK